ncbi:hypothetical protein IC744_00480 [Microbacterium hominis]|nr:hypothetical protein IC744_00480 [Microbacterium hominis]
MNHLRGRFVIEENAVMIGYGIHVGTPKTHKKLSVAYLERLAPMIEQACVGTGPGRGCSSATASTTCATRVRRDRSRMRSGARRLSIHRSRDSRRTIPVTPPHRS